MAAAPTPPEFDPYAAPTARTDVDRLLDPSVRAPGEAIKWVYLALGVASSASFLGIRFASVLGLDHGDVSRLIALVDGPLRWAIMIVGLAWVHQSWSGVPRGVRGELTPGGALIRFLAPIYNLYWVFEVNLLLCRAIDRVLERLGDARRAPKSIAIAAGVLHFAPAALMFADETKPFAFVVTIADYALWFFYMLECDVLRRAVLFADVDDEHA
jgi:hypothetical protein